MRYAYYELNLKRAVYIVPLSCFAAARHIHMSYLTFSATRHKQGMQRDERFVPSNEPGTCQAGCVVLTTCNERNLHCVLVLSVSVLVTGKGCIYRVSALCRPKELSYTRNKEHYHVMCNPNLILASCIN